MKFFRDFLLAALVTIALLLLLEGSLRIAHAHFESSLYQSENERGFSLRPNSEGWSVDEAEVYVRINSDGMRDRERSIVRPPDTLRVAVIGSSEVDARQVPLEDTFESVLGRDLSRALKPQGWHVDVLNFGVPGYTYSQEYLTLKNHVWKYQPQIVVLLFSSFPVLKTVRTFYPSELKGAPVYEIRDGKLVPDYITRNSPPLDPRRQFWKNRASNWLNGSDLLSLLNSARVKLRELVSAVRIGRQAPPTVSQSLRQSYSPDLPETQQAWSIAEELIKAMKEDCDRHGADFWIVTADQEMQVDPSIERRTAFRCQMGLASLDEVDQRVKRFALGQQIPVFALADPLGKFAVSHHLYLHGSPSSPQHSGHWNKVGNEQAGHAIAKELLAHDAALARIEQP